MKKSAAKKAYAADDSLPHWNLAKIYPGITSPELLADKEKISRLAGEFKAAYEGRVELLSGAKLGRAIEEYEQIQRLCHSIGSYLFLLESDDQSNFAKTALFKKWDADVDEAVAFFIREIGSMKEADLMTKLVVPYLARYAPWIARQRERSAPSLLEENNRAADDAETRRLYLEAMADINPDHDRQQSAAVLRQKSAAVAAIYNRLIENVATNAALEKHDRPDQGAHRDNGLSPEIVDTMFETVKGSLVRLSHRFHDRMAARQGVAVLKSADLHEAAGDEGREYSWDETRRLVLRSFRKFSRKFGRIAQKIFDADRIDAPPRDGKYTGAFSMPMGPGQLPFILLNFTGGVDDAVTAGHELGHGVHQVLAEKAQGMFLSNVPDIVSETSSIFAEMLIFEELYRSEKDPDVRCKLLENRVKHMLDNALQQASYYDFERRVHAERKNGALDAERISDIWVETQKEYYGPSIELDAHDRYFWMMVTHFFETPFYVYSYSFAQIAVAALFQEYKKAKADGPAAALDFANNYTELLETGMSRNIRDMFEPFGLDPSKPECWENGLSLIEKYLDDLAACDAAKPVLKTVPKAKPPAPGF